MTQSGSSLHQSALLLHAMTENDRDWLLARLEQHERERLRALLDELRSLGIPADESVLSQGLASSRNDDDYDSDEQRQAPIFDHVGNNTAMERMWMAGSEQLAAILKTEPDLLVARFLSMHPWPWHEEVLARLGPVKGRAIRKHIELLSLCTGSDGEPLAGEHTSMAKMLMSLVWAQLEERRGPSPVSEPARYRNRDHGLGRWHWFRFVNRFAARFFKLRRA